MCNSRPIQHRCGCPAGYETIQCLKAVQHDRSCWPIFFGESTVPRILSSSCRPGTCPGSALPMTDTDGPTLDRETKSSKKLHHHEKASTNQAGLQAQPLAINPSNSLQTHTAPQPSAMSSFPASETGAGAGGIPPVQQTFEENGHSPFNVMPNRRPRIEAPQHRSRALEYWQCCLCRGTAGGASGAPCFGSPTRPCGHQRCANCTPRNMGSKC